MKRPTVWRDQSSAGFDYNGSDNLDDKASHEQSQSRCHSCGDPAPSGWCHCLKCHSWNDLSVICMAGAGLDSFRLRRARAYFARKSNSPESRDSLLAKLARRVADLEIEVSQ